MEEDPIIQVTRDLEELSELEDKCVQVENLVNRFSLEKVIFKGNQDSYQIHGKLGRGGCGDIYRVQPLKNKDLQYAMKIVSDESLIEMEKEILNMAKSLHSIHLPQIHDSGYHCISYTNFDIDHYYIVMDLLGPNVWEFCQQKQCSIKMWLKICEQCLIAIEALHSLGYLHRDLKPDNFVLGRKGSDYFVVIIDFGLSEAIKDAKCDYRGTIAYGSIGSWEGKPPGPKDDLESWFYMISGSMSKLPWIKEGQEDNSLELKKAIRDEKTKTFQKFFCNFGLRASKDNYYDIYFVKIMRYVDSLKVDEVPDYNRIHYFLRCAYQKACEVFEKLYIAECKTLKYEYPQAREEYISNVEQEEKEVAKFQRFSRGHVEEPPNFTFFSSIVYDENGKHVKNIEYCGVSLNLYYKPAKPNQLVFQCRRCINSKPCGLRVCVYYEGNERTWDEARIEKITGDPNNCQKLKKLKEAYKLFVEGMKSNGK